MTAPHPAGLSLRCTRCGAEGAPRYDEDDDARIYPPEGWSRFLYTREMRRLASVDLRYLCTSCTNGIGRFLAGRDVKAARETVDL